MLIAEGYEDAKEYMICLSDVHPQHWDILESKSDLCCYCGEKGAIAYYYLGLKGKIKRWVSHPDMCYKLLSHWREKEHWLNRNEGWHVKKELWDGKRFAELSWFWDPNTEYCLPVRCQYPGCNNIISAETVLSADKNEDGYHDVIAVIVPSILKQNMLEEILETLLLWVSNLFCYSEDNLNRLVNMYCS